MRGRGLRLAKAKVAGSNPVFRSNDKGPALLRNLQGPGPSFFPPGRPGRVDDEADLIEGQRFVDALRHLPGRYGADRVRAPPLAGRDGLLEHSVNDRT